jgi:hypothetical protein
MFKIDGDQVQEFSISTPKFKGSRELKNLECLINGIIVPLVPVVGHNYFSLPMV